ncbi:flagellar hook-length control protein FliK [Desulfofalx alkaliphila]|uniref:flagellar hook-length control protein FliK n=1 Tax=Desulfofalx alkaliphila TaxID=105483 RepID=UPI0004E195E1|nr:flagellar hook-length control protein FliK [Desulfofalx alkaliphila]
MIATVGNLLKQDLVKTNSQTLSSQSSEENRDFLAALFDVLNSGHQGDPLGSLPLQPADISEDKPEDDLEGAPGYNLGDKLGVNPKDGLEEKGLDAGEIKEEEANNLPSPLQHPVQESNMVQKSNEHDFTNRLQNKSDWHWARFLTAVPNQVKDLPAGDRPQNLEQALPDLERLPTAVKNENSGGELSQVKQGQGFFKEEGLMLQSQADPSHQKVLRPVAGQQEKGELLDKPATVSQQLSKGFGQRPVENAAGTQFKEANMPANNQGAQQNIKVEGPEGQNFSNLVQNPTTGGPAKAGSPLNLENMTSRLLEIVKEMYTRQQPSGTTVRLKLEPQHLGEVTVRLTYSRGEINAQFYATTAHGKEALENALPQLRETLFSQQVKLNEANVFYGQADSWAGKQGRYGGRGAQPGKGYGFAASEKIGAVDVNHNQSIDDGLNLLI